MKYLRKLATVALLALAASGSALALTPSTFQVLFSGGWWLPGASVDMNFAQAKYYGCDISCISISRASTGYAQTSSGLLVPFGSNVARITDQGFLIEEARTNVALWNRDLTNVAWTKSNIAAALDQTGADGAANVASSLTATAGNGTALQAITLASSARFQSVYMKRITGSGNVDMTTDNGATWTTVSGAINSSVYTRVTIPTQTLANPTVGFRIVTNGDKVAVDFVQNENGAFATSPILATTASATRAADNVTAAGALKTLLQGTAGAVLVQTNGLLAASGRIVSTNNVSSFDFLEVGANNKISIFNSSSSGQTATFASGTFTGGVVKSALGWNGSSLSLVGNNGTLTNPAGGTWPFSFTAAFIGSQNGSTSFANGYYSRVVGFSSQPADATLKAFTQ